MKLYYFIGNTHATHTLIASLPKKNTNFVIFEINTDTTHNDHSYTSIPFSIDVLTAHIHRNTVSSHIEIIITSQNISKNMLKKLYTLSLQLCNCSIHMLPKIFTKLESVQYIHLRELTLEDVLFEEVTLALDTESLSYFNKKKVLITGAGGTLGSELAIQLLHTNISTLYLLGHGEYSIYTIKKKLESLQRCNIGTHIQCIPLLCELLDKDMVEHYVKKIQPHIIFHTAANKHVDLIEQNPIIGISSNIFATKHLLDVASNAKVDYFVYMSSDKSVEPVSIYGASKLIAEELVYTTNSAPMKTVVVRSGNILGSRGSFLPLLQQQIRYNNQVTLTSPQCKRFFISCSELTSLLLHYIQEYNTTDRSIIAIFNNKNISIYDLLMDIIALYTPLLQEDIHIQYTGLRPGEKLCEKFFFTEELQKESGITSTYTITRNKKYSPINNLHALVDSLNAICYKHTTYSDMYHDLKKTIALLDTHITSFSYDSDRNITH